MNGIPLLSLPRKSFALPMPHLYEPSPCARHCFAHAQAIALRMRAPLLCACAGHYTAHVHNSQTCFPPGHEWRGQNMVDFRSQWQGQLAILESLWTLYTPQIKSINRNTCIRSAIVMLIPLVDR